MPQSLAARIRAKYPGAYDDLDDAALEKAVLAKHPEYADLAQPDVTSASAPQGPSLAELSAQDPNIPADFNDAGGPVLRFARAHPGTAGAMAAGLAAAPFTGGLSLGGTMLAEAGAAGAGTVAGNLIGGKPQDIPETLVNASLGATGPLVSSVGRAGLAAVRAMPSGAVDVASHLPVVGKYVRGLRLIGGMLDRVSGPAAAPEAETAVSGARSWLDAPPGDYTPTISGPEPPARVGRIIRSDKYAGRADAAPTPAAAPESSGPVQRWQPDPADIAAERAFKQGLINPTAPIAPEPAHTPTRPIARTPPPTNVNRGQEAVPSETIKDLIQRLTGGVKIEPVPAHAPTPASASDAARAFAERFDVTEADGLKLYESRPELKSMPLDAMIRALLKRD